MAEKSTRVLSSLNKPPYLLLNYKYSNNSYMGSLTSETVINQSGYIFEKQNYIIIFEV